MANKFLFFSCTIFSVLTVGYLPNPVYSSQFEDYWIGSTKLLSRSKRSISTCENTFHVDFGNSSVLKLCVFRSNLSTHRFIDQNSKLHIFRKTGEVTITRQYSDLDYVALKGYVVGEENDSKVEGYLYKDRFIGRIYTRGRTLYVEELADFANHLKLKPEPGSDSIIYESVKSAYKCAVSFEKLDVKQHELKENEDRLIDYGPPLTDYSSRYLKLEVFIDTAFFKLVKSSDVDKTMFAVIQAVEIADKIFRSSEFMGNGKASNVGIRIADTYLYQESSSTSESFLMPLPTFYPFRRNINRALLSFARIQSMDSDLCILITGQVFYSEIVGLAHMAYPGPPKTDTGICAKRFTSGAEWLNKAIVSGAGTGVDSDYFVTQLEFDNTVVHEIAHTFGAKHDNDAKDSDSCKGDYIMGQENKLTGSMFTFSSCSIKEIDAVLKARGSCLTPEFESQVCGNKVVEKGEDCDCGSRYNCETTKACCYAHDSQMGVPCTNIKNSDDCNKPP